jgi:hypothetical protein
LKKGRLFFVCCVGYRAILLEITGDERKSFHENSFGSLGFDCEAWTDYLVYFAAGMLVAFLLAFPVVMFFKFGGGMLRFISMVIFPLIPLDTFHIGRIIGGEACVEGIMQLTKCLDSVKSFLLAFLKNCLDDANDIDFLYIKSLSCVWVIFYEGVETFCK